MQWDQETVLKLIEIYRAKEILWDPKHKHYYNKVLKNDAWVEISEEMKYTVSDLKKKIDSLLGQLRREKAKIKKRTGQGADEVYRSSWYAYEHQMFLFERNKPRCRINTEELPEERNSNLTTQNLQSENEQSQNAENEYVEGRIENSENVDPNSSNSQSRRYKPIFQPPLPKRKKVDDSDSRMMNTAFDMLTSATAAVRQVSARGSTSSMADDSQMYANFIASKFRAYSQRTKNALQHKISNLLFQADNGDFEYYRQSTSYGYSTRQRTTPVQSPSPVMSDNELSYTSLPNTSSSTVNESRIEPTSDYVHLSAVSPTGEDTQDSFGDLINSNF